MEKIVNLRLMWHLESNSLLNKNQYGFRQNRSTTDVLIRIDSFIKTAFSRKEHVIAVFLDLQKAYETTWRHHIISILKDYNLNGQLPNFIKNFLTDRQMSVKINSTKSDIFTQYEGVPQGSVLSCTLFALSN